MSTSNNPDIGALQQQVLSASTLMSAGEYPKALSTIRRAKASHPKNIFIIALEKQLEKLIALSQNPSLSDPERRKELLDSLPTLAQRAIEGMNTEEPLPPSSIQPSEEREVAFAKLKGEYFQRTDGYMMNGEYYQALQEIKRILILEPENSSAKEYQKKVLELVLLKEKSQNHSPVQSGNPTQTRSAQGSGSAVRKPAHKAGPQLAHAAKPSQGMRPGSAKSRNVTIGVIPIFVGLLIATYFFTRQVDQNPTIGDSQTKTTPAPQNSMTDVSESKLAESAAEKTQTGQAASTPIDSFTRVTTTNAESTTVRRDTITAKGPPIESVADGLSPEAIPGTTRGIGLSKSGNQLAAEGSQGIRTERKNTASKTPQLAKLEVKPGISATRPDIKTPATLDLVERKAQIIHIINPKFPEAAQRTGLQGEVLVGVQIGPDGKPIQAKILRSSSPVFDSAVIEAVMRSTYSAGIMSGEPVTSWITFPISFKINKKNR